MFKEQKTQTFDKTKASFNLLFFLFFQTGHTALQKASAEGHFEVVKQLISRGCLIDHQDDIVSISLYIFFNPELLFFGIQWYSLKLDNKSLSGSALYELKSFISLIIKKGKIHKMESHRKCSLIITIYAPLCIKPPTVQYCTG